MLAQGRQERIQYTRAAGQPDALARYLDALSSSLFVAGTADLAAAPGFAELVTCDLNAGLAKVRSARQAAQQLPS